MKMCETCGARMFAKLYEIEGWGYFDACSGCERAPEACTCEPPPVQNFLTVSETKTGPHQAKGHSDTSDGGLLGGLRTGKWLDEQEFEPIHEVVVGLIPAGFILLIGKPKIGKSWVMGNILLSAAAGEPALGVIPTGDPQTVVYFALEDGDRRMQSRCWAILGEGVPIPEKFNYLTQVPPGRIVQTIEEFLSSYPETTLVVLDTLGKVMPNASPGESSYQRDYRIGGALKRIADEYPKLALVVIHHDRKAESGDFIDSVSGTQGLAGSADTIIVLSRKRGSTDGLIKITGRDIPEGEYAVTMEDGRFWRLDGKDLAEAAANARRREESTSLSETSAGILDYARQHPNGVKAKDVADRFGKDAYKYLDRQVKAGRLVKPRRGLYLVPGLSEVSEPSEDQVSHSAVSDTAPNSVRNGVQNEDIPWPVETVAPKVAGNGDTPSQCEGCDEPPRPTSRFCSTRCAEKVRKRNQRAANKTTPEVTP